MQIALDAVILFCLFTQSRDWDIYTRPYDRRSSSRIIYIKITSESIAGAAYHIIDSVMMRQHIIMLLLFTNKIFRLINKQAHAHILGYKLVAIDLETHSKSIYVFISISIPFRLHIEWTRSRSSSEKAAADKDRKREREKWP